MNIIFGTAEATKIQEKYIVLELDMITIKSSDPINTYCVLETVPLEELAGVEIFKKLHADLILKYRNRNWDFCNQALDQLIGRWGKEIDSFYEILKNRIVSFREQEPTDNWTYVIAKS